MNISPNAGIHLKTILAILPGIGHGRTDLARVNFFFSCCNFQLFFCLIWRSNFLRFWETYVYRTSVLWTKTDGIHIIFWDKMSFKIFYPCKVCTIFQVWLCLGPMEARTRWPVAWPKFSIITIWSIVSWSLVLDSEISFRIFFCCKLPCCQFWSFPRGIWKITYSEKWEFYVSSDN